MQTIVRTTIRIRKDLFDQSRLLSFRQGRSLQQVINDTLALGFGRISDLDSQVEAMEKIDDFRKSLMGKKININRLLSDSRKDLK